MKIMREWKTKKGGSLSCPFVYARKSIIRFLFRGELHFRRGGADIGIDQALEFGEVLLEHADQRTRGLVELNLVGPSLDRIEDMRFDAGQRGRHREAEIFVGGEIG